MSNDNSENKKLSRRQIVKGISVAGAAGVLGAAFQNCGSPAAFQKAESSGAGENCPPGSSFSPVPPVCEQGGNFLDGRPVRNAPAGDEHTIQVGFFAPTHFDHEDGQVKTQHILTVAVGANVSGGVLHPTDYRSLRSIHTITDIFVIDQANCQVQLWKRFSTGDQEPFAYFLLPAALVTASARLKIVVSCSVHGFYGTDLDLSSAPGNYAALVGTHNTALPFGGSTIKYPYIGRSATGGQGDLTPLHAPQVTRVTDNEVTAILGGTAAPHGRFGENHYISGGALFDQNGHLLAPPSIVRYGEAGSATTGPLIRFTRLNLAMRGVTQVRVVIFDTDNGMLQSFRRIS